MQDDKFAQADALLRPLIAANPKAAEPHYLLAYAFLREDKPADSLNEYTTAAALRTPTAAELRSVALDYVLLKDLTGRGSMDEAIVGDGWRRCGDLVCDGPTALYAGPLQRCPDVL